MSRRQNQPSRAPDDVGCLIHGHATLAALYPLDHRLVARLPLEADRHGPGFEHVLQRSKVLGCRRRRQRLGDLLDEPLLVGRTHLAKELKGVDGQLEVGAIDPRDHAHARLPALVQRL